MVQNGKNEVWSSWIKPSSEGFSNRKYRITSQNHGYTVEEDSIKNTDLEITHIALNDGTIEGLEHKEYPAFTVQYHPEASPGPEDETYLFDRFLDND